MTKIINKVIHNKNAPYWAAAMIVFGIAGLAPTWFDTGRFWTGYGLDIFGPAWNYILFRGLGTSYRDNRWIRFFTPWRTLIIFILVTYGIEAMQYFELYESTFDPWDLLAYVSLLIPLFFVDIYLIKKSNSDKSI